MSIARSIVTLSVISVAMIAIFAVDARAALPGFSLISPSCGGVMNGADFRFIHESQSGWKNWPVKDKQVQKLKAFIGQLRNLSSLEIQEVLHSLSPQHPLREIIYLALYDHETWINYVHKISVIGEFETPLTEVLFSTIVNMPPDLKDELRARIHFLYPLAPEGTDLEMLGREAIFSGRRALEYLATLLVNPWGLSQRFSPGEGLEFYSNFIEDMKGFTQTKTRGRYSSAEILAVLKGIQGWMNQIEFSSKDRHLLVAGSLVEGRADLETSDLDLVGVERADSKLTFALFNSDRDSVKALLDLQNIVDSKFKTPAHLKISRTPLTPTQAAQLSPVMFEVTPDDIILLIYPPIEEIGKAVYIEEEPFVRFHIR